MDPSSQLPRAASTPSSKPPTTRNKIGRLSRLTAWTRWFVTDEVRAHGSTVAVRATGLVLICPLIVVITLVPAVAELIGGRATPLSTAMAAIVMLSFLTTPFILRLTGSLNAAGGWLLFCGLAATFMPAYFQQGLTSILMVWFLVIPTIAGFLLGARYTVIFSLLSLVCISAFWLLESLPAAFDPGLYQEETRAFRWLNLTAALGAISALGMFWERSAERATREREELEAHIRQSQKLETVGMLAGGIAHDFNNILAGILGHASMLEGEIEDPRARRRVAAIVDSSRRAAVLVEQMLAYAGRARTRTGALDLPSLTREVVELVRPGLDKKTQLELDLDHPTPRLAGDPVQIQQVVMNLITNASEAHEGKRGTVHVRAATVDEHGHELSDKAARAATSGCYAMLEVQDEGCGIDPAKLESIFDPFYTTKPSGHGLGLAAVLGIVRSHGGDIEVDSTVGVGTRFRVLLPQPDAETLAAAEQEADAPRPRIRLPTMTGMSEAEHQPRQRGGIERSEGPGYVLIVDDEEMVRELAGEVLERAGHRVLLARDGDHGLKVFERHAPEVDLVVLDRTMPGLDGLELLGEIRKLRPDVPAIISSGYADDAGSRGLRSLGVDAVLQKPWAPRDLVQLVSDLGGSDRVGPRSSRPPSGGS